MSNNTTNGVLYNPPDPSCAADPRGMGVYFMECMNRYPENIAQPLISTEGKLMSPVFLVLKEQGGKFGPVVEANLFRAVNVYVTASKSGKLTSDHFKIWLEEVYFPNVGKTSALLLDAWSGHCPKIVEEAIPPNKNIILKKIPTGTTGYIQPLDVYGFRIWKNLENVDGDTGESQTYSEVLQRSIRVALEMKRRGLKESDIITLCSYNHMDCVLPFLAALFLGVHVASLDPSLPESDAEHLLRLVNPRLIFSGEESLSMISNVLKKTSLKAEIVVYGKSDSYLSFSEFLVENPNEKSFKAKPVENLDETATIFFSSGTTGLPKAICATHRGLISQQKNFMKGSDVTTVMYFTTFYWISAVMLLTMSIIKGGKRVICKKFSVDSVFSIIDKYQVTFAFMAPYHISQIVLHYKSIDFKISHFKSLLVGGGKVSKEHLLQMRKLLPPHVYISLCYGMTELCGCITSFNQQTDKMHILSKPTSSGKPYSGIDYKIVDLETDEVVGANKIGELRVRSIYLMNGYLNDPKSTESAKDEEGYFCTGDMAYYDEDHCFFIVDRIKELMKFQSWHIVPKELEDILVAHPDIKDAAVVGRPHDIDGEHPTAFIVLQPKSQISKNQIMDYFNEKIGHADRKKLRGGIQFIDSIPRTPSGKIKRKTLKELYFCE